MNVLEVAGGILSSAATPEFNCLLRVGVKSAQTLIHGDSFTGLARLGVRFALLFHTLSSFVGFTGRIITNRSLVPATDDFTPEAAIAPDRRQARIWLFASHRIAQ